MKSGKIKKIVIIIVDIFFIALMAFVTAKWIYDNKDYQTIKYKKFTFDIPKTIEYKDVNELAFQLSGDEYSAEIEFIVDPDSFVFGDTQLFHDTLVEDGVVFTKGYMREFAGKDVLVFEDYNDNTLDRLYFFPLTDYYFAQVILHSNDVEKIDDNIIEVVNIFKDIKSDPNNKVKYKYREYLPNN